MRPTSAPPRTGAVQARRVASGDRLDLDPEAGAEVTALTLKVYSHGRTVGRHGVIEHDDPVSFVRVPALQ
ncbi:MAG: hypothetical protein ABR613_10655 [Actinomycetota bacterium]